MIGATLFSGIGAPETAMPHWQWAWAAEIDKFASAVHAARHSAPNLGNVTAHDFTSRAAGISNPDVLVFGSPCQSFSVAGRRLGLDDPRECERLQGFPDDFTAIEYCGKPAADGPRYKALGNSMAVPVMRWILSRIEAVDAIANN
jgi:site-specific DNA-cytosine methylase